MTSASFPSCATGIWWMSEGIRVKEELDRAAMSDWPDSKLETVGMKRRTVDTISVDVKSEALAV